MLDLLGRLHILILHLPIGILLLGVIFEWLHYLKFSLIPSHIRSLIFGIGSLSALFACGTGYLLSVSGDYNYNLIEDHQWAGILTTIIALITWWTIHSEKSKVSPWLALTMAGGISIAGHLGGTITHGADFLSIHSEDSTKSEIPVFKIDDIENAIVYKDVIAPILDAKCVSCHGPSKMKGKLRIDSYEMMLKGGKSNLDLLSSEDGKSELINRLDLPISSDEHMPPKDKAQLTDDERSIIDAWISKEYSNTVVISELGDSNESVELVQRMIASNQLNESHHNGATIAAVVPDVEIQAISESELEAIRQTGIVVLPAGTHSPFLEVNFVNIKTISPNHWEAIEAIASNILRLKLSDLDVADEDMFHIEKMTHLTKLYLDNTNITDLGLSSLSELTFLNYLNVNNTSITNNGIDKLKGIVTLKTIYAYQTKVNQTELDADINVEIGDYKLEFYPEDTIRIPQ